MSTSFKRKMLNLDSNEISEMDNEDFQPAMANAILFFKLLVIPVRLMYVSTG